MSSNLVLTTEDKRSPSAEVLLRFCLKPVWTNDQHRNNNNCKGTIYYPNLDCCPFARNSHEVALHGICETGFVQRGLNDGWSFAPNHHRETLANTFHLLQNIVLSHKVDNANDKLFSLLVNSDENRIV